MSEFFTHKDFTYELKEIQGFYLCLVYERGQKKVLYQTKYFGSAGRARSTAMIFIQDYIAFEEGKKKAKDEEAKKKPKKGKKKRKAKKVVAKPPIPKTEAQEIRSQTSKPKPADSISDPALRQNMGISTPDSKPKEEMKNAQDLKSRGVARGRREGALNALIIFSALVLIVTGIVYAYPEATGNDDRQTQVESDEASTRTIEPVIELPDPRGAGDFQQTSSTSTPIPTITTTTTITPTSTAIPTQPPPKSTNTQSPTQSPSATITPTPSPTATPESTATPTPSPSPTNTFTPTATSNLPTETPANTPVPPTATATSTPMP